MPYVVRLLARQLVRRASADRRIIDPGSMLVASDMPDSPIPYNRIYERLNRPSRAPQPNS
jgi:hypothetical protein